MVMVLHRAIKGSFYFLFYFRMTTGWSFSGIRNVIKRKKMLFTVLCSKLIRDALGYHISIHCIKIKSVEKKRKRLVSVLFNI